MSDGDRLERLDVVAALLGYDRPLSDAEQAVIRSATDQERALAEGMGGGPEPLAGPDAEAIAGLLRLASGTDVVSLLRAGLREEFVPPDGSRRALGAAGSGRRCPGDGRAVARYPGAGVRQLIAGTASRAFRLPPPFVRILSRPMAAPVLSGAWAGPGTAWRSSERQFSYAAP